MSFCTEGLPELQNPLKEITFSLGRNDVKADELVKVFSPSLSLRATPPFQESESYFMDMIRDSPLASRNDRVFGLLGE